MIWHSVQSLSTSMSMAMSDIEEEKQRETGLDWTAGQDRKEGRSYSFGQIPGRKIDSDVDVDVDLVQRQ